MQHKVSRYGEQHITLKRIKPAG